LEMYILDFIANANELKNISAAAKRNLLLIESFTTIACPKSDGRLRLELALHYRSSAQFKKFTFIMYLRLPKKEEEADRQTAALFLQNRKNIRALKDGFDYI
jgi:hypothetical protein